MKKVWILEKWADRDTVIKGVEDSISLVKRIDADDSQKAVAIEALEERLEEVSDDSFNGDWTGWIGRTSYKQFCNEAIDSMYRHRNEEYKVRVVSAYIKDDADSWINYVNPVENEGVLRYLYVQAKNWA